MHRRLLRDMAILVSGSLVTLAVSVVTAKFVSRYLGPNGYGRMALFQASIQILTIVISVGTATAIVREGAAALQRGDETRSLSAMRLAAFALVGCGTVALATAWLVAAAVRAPVARHLFGFDTYAVLLAAVAATLAGLHAGFLNAYQRVWALALGPACAAAAAAPIMILLVAHEGVRGLQFGLLTVSGVPLLVNATLVRRLLPRPRYRTVSRSTFAAGFRQLARFGAAYSFSSMFSTGIQAALPLLVLSELGVTAVGQFRAATAVTVAYVAVLLNALAQGYYPRLAAAPTDEDVAAIVRAQSTVLLALAIPVIAAFTLVAPTLVRLLYTSQFAPAVGVLRWQLVGDVVRFASWTISYVILARASSRRYLASEVIGGLAILVATALFIRGFGLIGAGIGFLVGYAIYYLTVEVLVGRQYGLRTLTAERVAWAACALLLLAARLSRSLAAAPGVTMLLTAAPLAVVILKVKRESGIAKSFVRRVIAPRTDA